MSYHSDLDYECHSCGEHFLPFRLATGCPRCGTTAREISGIVEETLEALRWHEYDHPGAYGLFSLADRYILFASEAAGTVKPGDNPTEVALRSTSRMEVGREHHQAHLCKFLETILPTVIEKKFQDSP
jgi:hypothetical protein